MVITSLLVHNPSPAVTDQDTSAAPFAALLNIWRTISIFLNPMTSFQRPSGAHAEQEHADVAIALRYILPSAAGVAEPSDDARTAELTLLEDAAGEIALGDGIRGRTGRVLQGKLLVDSDASLGDGLLVRVDGLNVGCDLSGQSADLLVGGGDEHQSAVEALDADHLLVDVGAREELIMGGEERRGGVESVGVGEDLGVGDNLAIVRDVGLAELAGGLGWLY